MSGLIPFPHTIHHHTTRLTHREAHTILSTFLQTAETNPAYRPDSTLSSHGVISSSTTANQNLTLNHLGRILKGIAGERVGGTGDFDEFFGYRDPRRKRRQEDAEGGVGNDDGGHSKGKRRRVEEVHDDNDAGNVNVNVDSAALVSAEAQQEGGEADDWQDKEDYEHAQIEGTREILLDDEDPTRVGNDGGGTNEVALEDVEIDVGDKDEGYGNAQSSSRQPKGQKVRAIDKDARKQAKKEKRKEELRLKGRTQMAKQG